jgi:hypothetical protein
MTRYAVVILLALTMPASAQDTNSANYFLPACKGFSGHEGLPPPNEALRRGFCAGIVIGLAYGAGGKDFCQPNGVTTGQAVAVVVKYIEARPERTHEDFGKLALEALTAAWPCKR